MLSAVNALPGRRGEPPQVLAHERHAVLDGVGEPSHDRAVAVASEHVAVQSGLADRFRGESRLVVAVHEHELVDARAG